jgi:hypothetical protein
VIGKPCDRATALDALSHVAAYTLGLDITVRGTEDRSFRKSIDTYTVLGPWLTTADELPDPDQLQITLHQNGSLRQNGHTSNLVYSVARLIEFASGFYTLQPGDLLYSGTPEGVGPIRPGDDARRVRGAWRGGWAVRGARWLPFAVLILYRSQRRASIIEESADAHRTADAARRSHALQHVHRVRGGSCRRPCRHERREPSAAVELRRALSRHLQHRPGMECARIIEGGRLPLRPTVLPGRRKALRAAG